MIVSPGLQDQLTSGIYAALLGTRPWEDFVGDATRLLPNGKATLLHHDTRRGTGGLSIAAGFSDAMMRDYAAHYARINPWMPHAARRPIGEASSTKTMLAPTDLRRTEFHADFLRTLEVSHGIGITLARRSHLNFYLSIIGADCDDATLAARCSLVEAIAPHLRQAFALAQVARPGDVALAPGVGQIVLGAGGRVQRCSAAAEAILAEGDGLWLGRDGTLRHAAPKLADEIAAVSSAWFAPAPATAARRVLLPRGDDRLPLGVTVLRPGRDAAEAFFMGPQVVLIVEDAERNRPKVASFGAFYNLTDAETRVYQALADGLPIAAIARRDRVSVETVRSQVKNLLRKTGRRSQSDLVGLAHELGRSAFLSG